MFDASSNRTDYQYSSWDEGRSRVPWGAVLGCLVLLAAACGLAWVVYEQRGALVDSRVRLEQAMAEGDRAKADLGRITALAADLQLQLDKTKAQRTEQENEAARPQALQAEVAEARGARADLQGKLDRAQADLHAQQTQVADLQARLAQAGAGSSELPRKADQVAVPTEAPKALPANEPGTVPRLPPPAVQARPLPITTSFKKGFWSHRFTLRVKNFGSDPVRVDLRVAGAGETLARSLVIAAGKTFELGKLRTGARVIIGGEGFASAELTVP